MGLWKIVPVARKDSPQWLDHPIWREVVARASTAAQARLLAADMERRQVPERVPAGNENPSFQSGFSDEKLYWVVPLNPDEFPELDPDGKEEIVSAVRETPRE